MDYFFQFRIIFCFFLGSYQDGDSPFPTSEYWSSTAFRYKKFELLSYYVIWQCRFDTYDDNRDLAMNFMTSQHNPRNVNFSFVLIILVVFSLNGKKSLLENCFFLVSLQLNFKLLQNRKFFIYFLDAWKCVGKLRHYIFQI